MPVSIVCSGHWGIVSLSGFLCCLGGLGLGSNWYLSPGIYITILRREWGKGGPGCARECILGIFYPRNRFSLVVIVWIVSFNLVHCSCDHPHKSILRWPLIWWLVSVWPLRWISLCICWSNLPGRFSPTDWTHLLLSPHRILLRRFLLLLYKSIIFIGAPGVLQVCH